MSRTHFIFRWLNLTLVPFRREVDIIKEALAKRVSLGGAVGDLIGATDGPLSTAITNAVAGGVAGGVTSNVANNIIHKWAVFPSFPYQLSKFIQA